MPAGHASHHRPSRSPIHTSPNPASAGRQNANITIRSGGNQPVRAPTGSMIAVRTTQTTRNRRVNPRARNAPAIASALVMKGA